MRLRQSFYKGAIGTLFEQSANGFVQFRMHEVWTQLGKRFQCEASGGYSWMRDVKTSIVNNLVGVKEDVDINDSCTPLYAADPSHRSFDGVDAIQ